MSYLRTALRSASAAAVLCAGGLALSVGPARADHVTPKKLQQLQAALDKSEEQLARREAELTATVALMNARSDQYDEVQAQAAVVGERLVAVDEEAAALESLLGDYLTRLGDARLLREAACRRPRVDDQCEQQRAAEAALAAELRPQVSQARSDLVELNRERARLLETLTDLDRRASRLIDEIFRLDGAAGLLRDRIDELSVRIMDLERQIADATHTGTTEVSL